MSENTKIVTFTISVLMAVVIVCWIVTRPTNIDQSKISDAGRTSIGNNVNVQKYYIGSDRVYILVNDRRPHLLVS